VEQDRECDPPGTVEVVAGDGAVTAGDLGDVDSQVGGDPQVAGPEDAQVGAGAVSEPAERDGEGHAATSRQLASSSHWRGESMVDRCRLWMTVPPAGVCGLPAVVIDVIGAGWMPPAGRNADPHQLAASPRTAMERERCPSRGMNASPPVARSP